MRAGEEGEREGDKDGYEPVALLPLAIVGSSLG